MTPAEFAATLTGATYRNPLTREQAAAAKQHGLVVVYGMSDDLMEFDGAIRDEIGCYDGDKAKIDAKGVLPDRDSIETDAELADYFRRVPHAAVIEPIWSGEEGYSWTYKTDIPHATFEITEDGAPYCRGIVLALASLPGA